MQYTYVCMYVYVGMCGCTMYVRNVCMTVFMYALMHLRMYIIIFDNYNITCYYCHYILTSEIDKIHKKYHHHQTHPV